MCNWFIIIIGGIHHHGEVLMRKHVCAEAILAKIYSVPAKQLKHEQKHEQKNTRKVFDW